MTPQPPFVPAETFGDLLQHDVKGPVCSFGCAMKLRYNAASSMCGDVYPQTAAGQRYPGAGIDTSVEVLVDQLCETVFGVLRKSVADVDLFT